MLGEADFASGAVRVWSLGWGTSCNVLVRVKHCTDSHGNMCLHKLFHVRYSVWGEKWLIILLYLATQVMALNYGMCRTSEEKRLNLRYFPFYTNVSIKQCSLFNLVTKSWLREIHTWPWVFVLCGNMADPQYDKSKRKLHCTFIPERQNFVNMGLSLIWGGGLKIAVSELYVNKSAPENLGYCPEILGDIPKQISHYLKIKQVHDFGSPGNFQSLPIPGKIFRFPQECFSDTPLRRADIPPVLLMFKVYLSNGSHQ